MKTVELDVLREVLQSKKAHFEYQKKDGTMRKAYGTLQFAFIPESMQPKHGEEMYENFRYYDLEKEGWRSISKDVSTVTVF